MKTFACFALALTLISCASAAVLTVNFGDTFSVEANVDYSVLVSGIATLDITVDGDANVTVSTYLNLQTSLPSGIQTFSFASSAQVGISLNVVPSSVSIVSASFTTPPLSAAAIALLSGSGNIAGCLQYDYSTQTYNYIEVPSVGESMQIVVPIPSSGIYVFVLLSANVTVPVWYAVRRTIPPHVERKFQFPGGFALDLTVDTSNGLTVYVNETNPTPKQFADYVLVNYYYPIVLESETAVNATLRYVYNKTEIIAKNIVETTLRWAFYNETAAAWQFVEGYSVDVSATVVIQQTNHFSTWAVYGSQSSTTEAAVTTTGSDASKTAAFAYLIGVLVVVALFL